MNNPYTDFHPYDGIPPSEYPLAESWLFCQLQLRYEHEGDWAVANRDRVRAHEFANYYFGHPELRGFERALCADLVVESAVELIAPEPVDGHEPAPDQVAEALISRLLADKYTEYYMNCYVSPEMRAARSPLNARIEMLYDRVKAR